MIGSIVSFLSGESAQRNAVSTEQVPGQGRPFPGRGRLIGWFLRWRSLRRSRRALDRLTETDLRDIGLSRNQARSEYRKSRFID